MPPWSSPGISCALRGITLASALRPGTETPWNRSGSNSIQSPDQLISQPMTPVKTGMVRMCSQSDASACVKNQSTSSARHWFTSSPLGERTRQGRGGHSPTSSTSIPNDEPRIWNVAALVRTWSSASRLPLFFRVPCADFAQGLSTGHFQRIRTLAGP